MATKAKSYYEVLNVPSDADEATIRNAYRKEIRKYHPDLNSDKSKANKRTRQLNVAVEVLTDPEKRKLYDDKLRKLGKTQANAAFERNSSDSNYATRDFEFDTNGSDSRRRSPKSARKNSNKFRTALTMVFILIGGWSGVCTAVLLLWVFFQLDPTGLIEREQRKQVKTEAALQDDDTSRLDGEIRDLESQLAESSKEVADLNRQVANPQSDPQMDLLKSENARLTDEIEALNNRLDKNNESSASSSEKRVEQEPLNQADWRTVCWTQQANWHIQPLSQMTVRLANGILHAKNSYSLHPSCKLAYARALVGDFHVEAKIKGEFTLEVRATSLGVPRFAIPKTHSEQPINFVVKRKGGELSVTADGRKMDFQDKGVGANPKAPMFFCVTLAQGDECEISSFVLDQSTNVNK